MIEPFAKCLAKSNDYRLKKDIHQFVFSYLIKQSDEGIEYEEKGLDKQAVISMSDAKANRKKALWKAKKNKMQVKEEEEKEEQVENEKKGETVKENKTTFLLSNENTPCNKNFIFFYIRTQVLRFSNVF